MVPTSIRQPCRYFIRYNVGLPGSPVPQSPSVLVAPIPIPVAHPPAAPPSRSQPLLRLRPNPREERTNNLDLHSICSQSQLPFLSSSVLPATYLFPTADTTITAHRGFSSPLRPLRVPWKQTRPSQPSTPSSASPDPSPLAIPSPFYTRWSSRRRRRPVRRRRRSGVVLIPINRFYRLILSFQPWPVPLVDFTCAS